MSVRRAACENASRLILRRPRFARGFGLRPKKRVKETKGQRVHIPSHSSLKQRTENPFRREKSLYRRTPALPEQRSRYHAFEVPLGEALHQQPKFPSSKKFPPLPMREPPGNAEKPEVFVPFQLGSSEDEDFIWAPWSVPRQPVSLASEEVMPNSISRVIHSPSVGTCQPLGHKPRESSTAYQLYRRP